MSLEEAQELRAMVDQVIEELPKSRRRRDQAVADATVQALHKAGLLRSRGAQRAHVRDIVRGADGSIEAVIETEGWVEPASDGGEGE